MNNRERAEQILARLDELDHSGTKGMKWGYNKGKPNGKRKAEGEKDEKSLGNAVGNAIAKNVKPFADAFGLVADKIVQGLKEKADDNWLIPYGEHQYNRLPGTSKDWTSHSSKIDALDKVNHRAFETFGGDFYNIKLPEKNHGEDSNSYMIRVNELYTQYFNNCTNCAFAFELRMRGYDVEAQPMWKYAKYGERFSRMYYGDEAFAALSAPFVDDEGKSPEWGSAHIQDGRSSQSIAQSTERDAKAVREKFVNEYGEGARGYFVYVWDGGGAHINNWVVENGDVVIYDAQVGKKRTLEEDFSRAYAVTYVRTDNCTAVETEEEAVSSYLKFDDSDTWKKEGKRR